MSGPGNMADPAAIRELRRQRILQSGQNRMNKVLGKPQNDNEQGFASTETKFNDNNRPGANNEPLESSEPETTLRQRTIISPQKSSNESGNEPQTIKNTVKVSPIKRPLHTQNDSANESLNSSRSSSDAKMMLKHFEFLRIVMCVMVAYLCRRVLSSGYGIFYFESVILPFACLEVSFFLFKHKVLHNVMLPHKSSMLIGVLMLCGIKPVIVQTYNKVMGYFTAAMEDFALFFFAFMMANTFIA